MMAQQTLPMQPPESIADLVFRAAQCYPDIIALEEADEKILYRELPKRVSAISKALIGLGIEPGDRVAVWGPNSNRWVLTALGLQLAGAVLVPLNTRMKAGEAADILQRSGSRVLFLVGDFLNADYPSMIRDQLPDCVEHQVLMSPRQAGAEDKIIPWQTFLSEADQVSDARFQMRATSITGEHLSDLMFTSGTTGKPKGVMSSHGACMKTYSEYVQLLGYRPGDRYLIINPFFHAFGYKAGWLSCLLAGVTILPQTTFDAEEVLRRIEQDRISILPGPPTLYLSLLAHPELEKFDLSSLRVAVTGAATIPPVLIERMRTELGIDTVTTAYGLTECGGTASICPPDEAAETIAMTSGKALSGTEISIQSPDGQRLPPNQTGEICIRGFHTMKGYFQDDKATAEALDAEGWLHTGDLGTLDDRGFLRITGRLKEMFIVGGFNCYPAEIEAILSEHPDIAQSAVIGVPDERMGEVGCAYVIPRSGSQIDDTGLINWCRQHMANYKVPRHVRIVRQLPVNASNKVLKNELLADFQRQPALAG